MNLPLRIVHFSAWADRVEEVDVFLQRLPQLDLRGRVSNPNDAGLIRMARLDADWHGENARAFAAMTHPDLRFLPARVTGITGLLDLTKASSDKKEETWLIFDGQGPQKISGVLDKLMPLLVRAGVRVAWYSFDESSRTTTAFKAIGPYLDLLIHDELPLEPPAAATLRPSCLVRHRSWVANVVPFSLPFNERPEEKILFLGSKLGLTEHRQKQISFLQKTFGPRLVAIHDHSVGVAERASLNRFKVSLCPEGRKFTTPAMSQSHTDRPFWSGCLGLVSVSENSIAGDRLSELAGQGLIERYAHGDLRSLKTACERALAAPLETRQKIYEHFNRYETVGAVLADALAEINRSTRETPLLARPT